MDESTAIFSVGYSSRSSQARMYANRRRYHLNRNLRLLANFREVNKLVVHYLSTLHAAMQYVFG